MEEGLTGWEEGAGKGLLELRMVTRGVGVFFRGGRFWEVGFCAQIFPYPSLQGVYQTIGHFLDGCISMLSLQYAISFRLVELSNKNRICLFSSTTINPFFFSKS